MKNTKTTLIAVANQKGDVAKTTTVINIGAGLALRGKKVLLVDADNQSHLSPYRSSDSPLRMLYGTLNRVLTISRLTLCLPVFSQS